MKLEEKYRELYAAWQQQKTPQTSGALLQAIEPILSTALRTYAGGDSGPILRSRARRIALDALPRYDPNRTQLNTFLMQHLQGLRRAKAQTQAVIQIPELIRLQQQQLAEAHTRLRDRLGRDPSTHELSDTLNLPPARIATIRSASSGLPEGAMRGQGESSEEQFSPAVQGTSHGDNAWAELVYHGLDPSDQVILEHSVGLFGRPKLSNNAIAKRIGVTPSAVSQRRSRIQGQLDQRDELGGGF